MEKPLTALIDIPQKEPPNIKAYERSGGWTGLHRALLLEPTQIIEIVKQSNLRGRGGAGFATGTKWSLVPPAGPKFLIANADEMEPGTFKDRLLLEGNPLQLIEGMAIAAYAIGAQIAYIFLRPEYVLAEKRLRKSISEAYEKKIIGKKIFGSNFQWELHLHMSAGRYMCGEETGLLNALEGKRPNPRAKPPYPQLSGLWGKPTVVQNVETLCNLPHILANGAPWFLNLSRSPTDGGTKLFGVSGRVRKPGLWELPMGTSLREIVEEHAGGMTEKFSLRALLPGGASTSFVTPEHLDVAMDFSSLQKIGSRMGTGTIIVLDDKTCPVGMVRNLLNFFAKESCGWCTPCWSGLAWCEQILLALEEGRGDPGDMDILAFQTWFNGPRRTFCALAPGAMEPLKSALHIFKDDFEHHLKQKRCPMSLP